MSSENATSSVIKITSVLGNSQLLDGGAMFGNAPRPMWEKWCKPDPQGRILLQCRCLLVEVSGNTFLCETGIGAFFDPQTAERYGVDTPETHQLLESLKKIGLSSDDIDFVILSHLHFDHAGGLLPKYSEISKGNDQLLFQNAKYVVGKKAFERSKKPHPRDRVSFIPGLPEKLEASGRLVLIDSTAAQKPRELDRHFSFFFSHGHTPGQMHSVVHGAEDKRSIIFAGDLVPGTAWVHLPITMGYDRFAELVIDEKRNLYERTLRKNDFLFYTHDSTVSASRVEKNEKGKFQAVEAHSELLRFEL